MDARDELVAAVRQAIDRAVGAGVSADSIDAALREAVDNYDDHGYPIYHVAYRCAQCDRLYDDWVASPPERTRPSTCCTYHKQLLHSCRRVRSPEWSVIKKVYG